MNNSGLNKLMEMEQTEQFWSELNETSVSSVEFLDAAVCLAVIRHLSHSEESQERVPQA